MYFSCNFSFLLLIYGVVHAYAHFEDFERDDFSMSADKGDNEVGMDMDAPQPEVTRTTERHLITNPTDSRRKNQNKIKKDTKVLDKKHVNKHKNIKRPNLYVVPSTKRTTTTVATVPTIPDVPYPPLSRRYRRIFNADEVASIEDFPFMAALLMNNKLWCGAAIVSRDKILTAAHCLQLHYNNRFFREYMKMLTVRVGSSNTTTGGEILAVAEIWFHPNYKPETLEFNLAILTLHKNMSFDKSEVPIDSIAYSNGDIIANDKKILFLGWGSVLGESGAGGDVLLQKVELPIYDQTDCQDIYGKDLVTKYNFCAGFITLKKNVCNHDAGGPAIMDGLLVGILSFSNKRCDELDKPAVFLNIGMLAPWINTVGREPPLP